MRLSPSPAPTHAEGVARDMPSAIVAASAHRAQRFACKRHFPTRSFASMPVRMSKKSSLPGRSERGLHWHPVWCASLWYRDNSRCAHCARHREMTRLGVAAGCVAETFSGLAGVGDLVVTASSVHSRNYRAGFLIAGGMSVEASGRRGGHGRRGLERASCRCAAVRSLRCGHADRRCCASSRQRMRASSERERS